MESSTLNASSISLQSHLTSESLSHSFDHSLHLSSQNSHETLRKVIVVSRHGIRNPKRIPEKWNFSVPDPDLGRLTHKGRDQMVSMGTQFRQQYWNLLDGLTNDQIFVRSTESHRTVESAHLFLQGLFQTEDVRFRSNHNCILKKYKIGTTQPTQTNQFFIHLAKKKDDDILKRHQKRWYGTLNSSIKNLKKAVKKSSEWKKQSQDNKEFMSYLSSLLLQKITLRKLPNVFSLFQWQVVVTSVIWPTRQPFLNHSTVKTLSEWVKTERFKNIGPQSAGYLALEIIESLREVEDTYKVLFYSAHDSTLSGLFYALGLDQYNDTIFPEFGAHYIFELWEDENGRSYVRCFYNWDHELRLVKGSHSVESLKEVNDRLLTRMISTS